MRISIFVPILLLSGCVCAPVVVNDTIQLPCCGGSGAGQPVNISTGTAPWRVTILPPSGSSPSQAALPASNPAWVPPSDPHFSQVIPVGWVGPPGPPSDPTFSRPRPVDRVGPPPQWDGPGDYQYEVRFEVPVCRPRAGQPPMRRSITVSGVFASDNHAVLSFQLIPVAWQPGTPPGFQPGAVTPFTVTVPADAAPGFYHLTVDVHNNEGPTGLIVQATAASTCAPAS